MGLAYYFLSFTTVLQIKFSQIVFPPMQSEPQLQNWRILSVKIELHLKQLPKSTSERPSQWNTCSVDLHAFHLLGILFFGEWA